MDVRTLLIVLALASAPVAAVGCGSGGNDETNAPSSSTVAGSTTAGTNATGARAKFIDAANSACSRSTKQMQVKVELLKRQATGESPNTLAKAVINNVVAPGMEEEIVAIRALDPPASDAKQVNAIIAAMHEGITEAKKDPLGFIRRARPFIQSQEPARAFGLTACGGL